MRPRRIDRRSLPRAMRWYPGDGTPCGSDRPPIRPVGVSGLDRISLSRGGVDEALTVLDRSAAAFDQIGQADMAAQVRALQERIRKAKG